MVIKLVRVSNAVVRSVVVVGSVDSEISVKVVVIVVNSPKIDVVKVLVTVVIGPVSVNVVVLVLVSAGNVKVVGVPSRVEVTVDAGRVVVVVTGKNVVPICVTVFVSCSRA